MAENDRNYKELSLMDKELTSLLEVSLNSHLLSVNLHCNKICKIEGLDHLQYLQHLDLSSNLITRIEGLDSLVRLRSLNLSCNKLTKIEGLEELFNLKELNLSYNQIQDLTGLRPLHGQRHKLSHLYLYSNCINDIDHVVRSTMGLQCLLHLTFEQNGKGNPVCDITGYREIILHSLPGLEALDGINRRGECVSGHDGGPNLEFLEYLVAFDVVSKEFKHSTTAPTITPRIDQVLSQYQKRPARFAPDNLTTGINTTSSSERDSATHPQTNNMWREMRIRKLEEQIADLLEKTSTPKSEEPIVILKAKSEPDLTTESDGESEKEKHKHSGSKCTGIPIYTRNSQTPKHKNSQQIKARVSNSVPKRSAVREQKSPSPRWKTERHSSMSSDRADTESTRQTHGKLCASQKTMKSKMEAVLSKATEESTYRALVQELDQERERRWKAEQVVIKLKENLKELQCQAKEEKDINSMAVYTTDRIKELLLKERNAKEKLQCIVHHLKEENVRLTNELKKSADRETDYQKALNTMEDALSKLETQRVQQQAMEITQIQEAERKVSASQREVDVLRVSVRQQKDKIQQLHELLTAKEQTHRKELESRVVLYGPEFQEAVAKEITKVKDSHSQQIHELQEKMTAQLQQYRDLEDEFRAALIIEAGRFKEVKDGFDNMTAELEEHRDALTCCRLKENQSSSLIQELTTLVKKQKARIVDITKEKHDMTNDFKSKIQTLEIEDRKRKILQIELFKAEKSKLISQLTAQESQIDGLKAERKIWEQEQIHQGISRAQDLGKLHAQIEVLLNEIETMKKQNERDNDALKIKTKVVDDQTETIRKLKEGLQERDERIRKLREENLTIEKAMQEQIDEKAAQLEELQEKLERQMERKEEVKQLLEVKEAELEDVKEAYSATNKKWQEKAKLLSQLETQVRQMKENFDAKEKKLIEEKNKSLQTQKALTEKLRSVDDAFRQQLESILATHEAEIINVTTCKQKEIEAVHEKVYQVEEEMRQLLQESARMKKTTQEKIKRLNKALSEIQEDQ
ncbi:leucine-rich repeat and coiled-coil domain-containing protein 1 [Pelodytes ibericus]